MAKPPKKGTLHIYLDESGDLDFQPTGSLYYVFSAVWTYQPAPLAGELAALRFRLLKQGHDIEHFHATSDNSATRELVIERLLSRAKWEFAAVVVEKSKVPSRSRDPLWQFYSHFATVPLRFILRSPVFDKAHKVLIFTDRFPQQVVREAASKAIYKECRSELAKPMRRWPSHEDGGAEVMQEILPDEGHSAVAESKGIPFSLYHHASASNAWLQVADYCAYVTWLKWERRDLTLYERLRPRLAATEYVIQGAPPAADD